MAPALRLALHVAIAATLCALLPPACGAGGARGACGPPRPDAATGAVAVTCLSRGVALAPGYNILPEVEMPNPYPAGVTVAVRTQSMGIVDAAGRQVPLNEVYLHHGFGDYNYIVASACQAFFALKKRCLRS
jgi:hypothetical protein